MNEILKNFLQRFKIATKLTKKMFITGILLLFIIIIFNIYQSFFGYSPIKATGDIFESPNSEHIMGTDQLGRDVFSRVSCGVRSSLMIAFLSVIIASTSGTTIGVLSGYFAGKIDRIFSIIFDALFAFPGLILAIIISTMVGPGIIPTSIAISIGYIPQYFRVVRGLTLSLKERPFIEALRALGARPINLIQHILIYTTPSIITLIMLNVASSLLAVSGLGFLGLGIIPPTPELGIDLGRGRAFITMGVWWTSFFPGLMIVISVAAFTLFGEGLNEILKTTMTGKTM